MSTFSERFAAIPPHLVLKVNGSTSESLFLWMGKLIAQTIEAEVDGFDDKAAILDFGCGLGRVLQELKRRAPQARLVGFDIDSEMLEACRVLLQDPSVQLIGETSGLPDESFDCIAAISVFSHLNRTAEACLAEIYRLLRPDGVAFVSYMDGTLFGEMARAGAFPGVPDRDLEGLGGQYVVASNAEEGSAAMGTYYTTHQWEELVRRHFRVTTVAPRGLFGHQSYTILRRKNHRMSPEEELAETRRRAQRYRVMAIQELQSTINYYKGEVARLEAANTPPVSSRPAKS